MLQSRLAPAPSPLHQLKKNNGSNNSKRKKAKKNKKKKRERKEKEKAFPPYDYEASGLVCRLNTFMYLTSCRDLCTTTAKDGDPVTSSIPSG
jgi:hypothetical protein